MHEIIKTIATEARARQINILQIYCSIFVPYTIFNTYFGTFKIGQLLVLSSIDFLGLIWGLID